MGRRAVLRLAQPLSPVEYDLRPDGRKPHRFRSDSLHLHPLLPSPSARNGGKHGLTPIPLTLPLTLTISAVERRKSLLRRKQPWPARLPDCRTAPVSATS